MAEKKIIMDLEINIGESLDQITKINKELQQLQKEKKELDKAIKDGSATDEMIKHYSEVTAAIKTLTRARGAEMKEIYQEAQQYRYAADTVQGMSDRLRQMKDEYVKMSAEMRNSPMGQQMAKDIRETTTALNVMKAEMEPSFIEKFNQKIIGITASFNRFPKTLGGLKAGLATITSAFKVLFRTIIMNPIGLLITAITGLLVIIGKFFKETEAGQRIMNVFGGSVDKITEGLKMMVNGIATAVEWVLKLIPAFNRASKEAEDYAAAVGNIQKREEALDKQREKNLDLNEREKKQIMDSTRSYEARTGILDRYLARNRELLNTQKSIAEQTKQELSIRQNLNEEDQKRLDNAIAFINYGFDAEMKKLQQEEESLYRIINEDQTKARQKAEEDAQKAAEKRQQENNKILQETQRLQQELSALWRDIYLDARNKEIEALDDTYQHNVDLIDKTVQDEEEKNKMLLDLTNKYRQDVKAINDKYDAEEAAKQKAERTKQLTSEETVRQLQAREATLKQMELDNQALFEARQDEVKRTQVALEQSQRRIEIAQQEADRIKNLTKEQVEVQYGEGEEGLQKWKNAQIEANNAVQDATRASILAQEDFLQALKESQLETIANFQTILQGMASLTGAFQSLFSTLAEDDAEMQKYSNALSYINIMVNMAEGIAGAIAQAQSVPFPANIAAMATGVAAVVTGIGEALAIYKKSKQVPATPKFFEGGLIGEEVHKPDSSQDDTVPILASPGEFVMKRSAVNRVGTEYLNALNSGSVPSLSTIKSTTVIDYDRLANMMADALQNVEIVTDVKEVTAMQKRVQIKENVATY